ncbi:MAG: Flp pilus assembly protein CpaB [Gammaproteobacteria bacterium]|nr:Flp pilus assembly protein CpaB [Gammaproteobacteria bacterium]
MAAPSGTKTGMLFIGAIGFGIAAAILSVVYLKSREAAIIASIKGEEQEMVAVVVAKEDLKKGQKVEPGLFAVRNIPMTYVHPNAIPPANIESYYGRFLVEDVGRGKPLLTNFMNETFPVDFSDLVSQSRRAITIQVDEVQSIAGLTRPGNRIDIYVNIDVKIANYDTGEGPSLPPGLEQAALQAAGEAGIPAEVAQAAAAGIGIKEKPTDVILPVLQDVRVLATGREAYDEHLDSIRYPQQRTELNFTSMTVDVTPEQAALLAIAEDKGDLIAVLRNRNDRQGADFTGITPFDLFSNAKEMKKQMAMRKAAEAAGATIDANGNWVTADGKVIKKDDIVISESGTVSTRGGKLLAADGISVNEKGEYVDASGKVIPRDEVIVNADGSITTKDALMKAAGYTVNENGDYVDASGNVVKKEDIIVNADGTVTTKDEMMKAAGYTINENGDYVDANGNVVKKDDLQVLANGTVMTTDGKVLSGPRVTVNEQGFIIAEDGTVMTADGKVLSGVAVNEKGEVVGPDGKVLKDANLTVAADGTVRDSSGNIVAGVSGSTLPPIIGEAEELIEAALPSYISLIIGGASKDGIAKSSPLLVQPLQQKIPAAEQ